MFGFFSKNFCSPSANILLGIASCPVESKYVRGKKSKVKKIRIHNDFKPLSHPKF
jgi:hypothetical protein